MLPGRGPEAPQLEGHHSHLQAHASLLSLGKEMGTEMALQVLEKKSLLAGRLIGCGHKLVPGTGVLIALKHLKTPRATGRNY